MKLCAPTTTEEPKYSISVYEDHAIITGWLTGDVLKTLVKLCEKEGFKYLTSNHDGKGFKLVGEK